MNKIDEAQIARVLDTALQLCIAQGNVMGDQICDATGFDAVEVSEALATLSRRGNLVARPGGIYARPLTRKVRLPGESWPTDLRLPVSALMVAR